MNCPVLDYFDKLKNELYNKDIVLDNITQDDDDLKHSLYYLDGFNFNCGATRGCFTPKCQDCDFVFKFDFSELNSDYCAREKYLYIEAQKMGLGFAFAKVESVDIIAETCIYVQDKVVFPYGDKNESSYSEEELNVLSDRISDYSYNCFNSLSLEWLKDFELAYGEESFQAFLEFCDEYCINDLHDGNVGYGEDGLPIVFDYAGYYENDF